MTGRVGKKVNPTPTVQVLLLQGKLPDSPPPPKKVRYQLRDAVELELRETLPRKSQTAGMTRDAGKWGRV